MDNSEQRYRELWSKHYNLSLRDCWILEEEISDIDEQIRRLKQRRAKLIARKHQECKERIEKEEKRKKDYPILYLPFKEDK